MRVGEFRTLTACYAVITLVIGTAITWLALALTDVVTLDEYKSISEPVEVAGVGIPLLLAAGSFYWEERSFPKEVLTAWRQADKATRHAYAKPAVFTGWWIGALVLWHTESLIDNLMGAPIPPLAASWPGSAVVATLLAVTMTVEIKMPVPTTKSSQVDMGIPERKVQLKGSGPLRPAIYPKRDGYKVVAYGGKQPNNRRPRRW